MSSYTGSVNTLRVLSAYLIHRYQLLDYADCSIIANSTNAQLWGLLQSPLGAD